MTTLLILHYRWKIEYYNQQLETVKHNDWQWKNIKRDSQELGSYYSPLLSSCCWMCFNKWECIVVIVMNSVWTELSLAMLRPLLELDFIRLTKISTCIFKVTTNSSISVSVSPFSWWCCWNNKKYVFRYQNQKEQSNMHPDYNFKIIYQNIFKILSCCEKQSIYISKQAN